MRITFICSGNTCRSPLAVAAWQIALGEMSPVCRAQLEQIEVGSAGLNARAGSRASALAQLVAANWNVDLSEHRAQIWQPRRGDDETLIAMTREQSAQIRFRLGLASAPVEVLGAFDDTATPPPSWGETLGKTPGADSRNSVAHCDIPDPYGGSSEAYEECGARILRGVRALAQSLCRQ